MTNGEPTAVTQARELLQQRDFRGALDLLTRNLDQDTDGEVHALLALAHYHLEEYSSAAEHYSAALEFDSDNQEWREMLATANANVNAAINVPVPDVYFFDRDKLLAKPIVPQGALPPRLLRLAGT